jgi:thiol-disulfide isomerase/thioredoxin
MCKYAIPALAIGGAVLMVWAGVKFINNNKVTPTTPSPSPSPAATGQPQARPYLRSVPSFPAPNASEQPPQPYDHGSGKSYSAFHASGLDGPSLPASAKTQLDQRYKKPPSNPYQDNNLPAYASYSDAVNTQGQVQQWDTATFNKVALQQKQPVLVAFMMNGCGHCERMKSAYAEAAKNAKIPLAAIIGADQQLLQKYEIRGFPTVLLFRGGEMVKKYMGDRSAADLVRFTE